MTTSHWLRPHHFRSSDVTTDVLIIGAGYAGLSTAYWLTETTPGLKITIIDRGNLGAGASGRNAGFLTKGSAVFYQTLTEHWGLERAKAIYNFAEESVQLAHQKVLMASPEIKYDKSHSLTLFENGEKLAEWKRADFQPEEFNFRSLSREDLPEPLQSTFCTAFENGPEYKINSMQLLASLKKTLESRKVKIIEGVSVFDIRESGVLTEINEIKTRQVVLALNAYFPQFHAYFRDLIIPRRAQMLAVELEQEFNCPALHYDPDGRVYFRKSGENILMIGGKRPLDIEGETGDFEKITPIIQDALENYLRERLRLNFRILHRWSGIMGFTEHELPFITRIQAPIEAFAIGGFSGHGMGMGFRSGMEMAQLITGTKKESFFDQFKKTEIRL